ncbi:hypothetical protein [Rhodococcus sp. NPDC056516]|uniref:hypothetical protein n=1 Tax=Rhodococcus sp. NPDC056516 TaxID=3345847 RepID=UPI0036732014
MSRQIVVWDPNPFNPYGVEVTRVIADSHGSVLRFGRRGQAITHGLVKSIGLLPPPAVGSRNIWVLVQYLAGLLAFVVYAIVRRPLVVVCWMNSEPERRIIRGLQLSGCRTLVVVHNPVKSRDDADDHSIIRSIRSGASGLLVHDSSLRAGIGEHANVLVAAHPAYLAWSESTEGAMRLPRDSSSAALYLGSARVDKGFDVLPTLAENLSDLNIRLQCAIGRLTSSENDLLRKCENIDVLAEPSTHMSDVDVRRYMESSSVLVAPYRDVTASGTILMALTVGLPVAAFTSDVLLEMLPADSLADSGDTRMLADCAARASDADRAAVAESARNHDIRATREWALAVSTVLDETIPGVHSGEVANV